MIRTEVIIGVRNVPKSSEWYQTLLNCKSKHGGETFEILADKDDDTVILCLHKWGAHAHSTLMSPDVKKGNGLILVFAVSNFEQVWENARELYAVIEEVPHLNENSGRQEFSLRDIDGYYVSIADVPV
ncbi:VOC family protein [Mucilaginibacter paludis]|uniref:Glyoxalase family protein n=1 Tax=Mucilaginibacter paludis DSM 18603 TaxID=714943 RepID=H1Y583_9SPHI|nr:VOC family protein [Mucilaginibacter paludis]EHQ28626.1 glyoxalase family protein [Mucilaginibacter paludis DSM 18603]